MIFGFFHFALFRIVPTAVLGFLLTSVALLTGSIFPCMCAHVGNNALAIFFARHHVDLEALPFLGLRTGNGGPGRGILHPGPGAHALPWPAFAEGSPRRHLGPLTYGTSRPSVLAYEGIVPCSRRWAGGRRECPSPPRGTRG